MTGPRFHEDEVGLLSVDLLLMHHTLNLLYSRERLFNAVSC